MRLISSGGACSQTDLEELVITPPLLDELILMNYTYLFYTQVRQKRRNPKASRWVQG